MRASLLCILASVAALAAPAWAHKPSDSYLSVTVSDEGVSGQWDIALRDLDYAIGLDDDGNGEITWKELKARHGAISAYALSRLQVEADDAPCALRPLEHLVDNLSDGAYEILRFTTDCQAPVGSLTIGYRLLFDLDPQHRGLVRLETPAGTRTAVLSPTESLRRFDLGKTDNWREFLDYSRAGVRHIWTGADHVLFLITLLLPAVLLRRKGAWQAVEGLRAASLDVVKIVTAFTIAHSVTLSLAALDVIAVPSRLVESVIALSIVVAALNNLRPLVTRRLWLVALGFGLFHGLGFAGVLKDLGLPQDSLLLSLIGFNLGVEAGQLAIVAAVLPVMFLLRQWRLYPRVALAGGSLAIAGLAALWLVERAFDLAPLI